MAFGAIQILGSGNAFNTDGRASQSILVEAADGASFLVDAGPTVTSSLCRFGFDPARLDRLFLTHLHGDHTAGWPFLLLHLVFPARRTRPFDVFGPVGTRACLEALSTLCYDDLQGERRFEIRYHEHDVEERQGLDAGDGIRFDTLPMVHHPTSTGLVFDLGGRRLAVSGDTGWCDNLERLGQASDLLILECTTLARQEIPHISLEELRSGHASLGGGEILLVHLTDAIARELASNPIPRLTAAYDGMRLAF